MKKKKEEELFTCYKPKFTAACFGELSGIETSGNFGRMTITFDPPIMAYKDDKIADLIQRYLDGI